MIKHIAFTMIPVLDMARARRFYEEELGLKMTHNFNDTWVEYHINGSCFTLGDSKTCGVKPNRNEGGSIAFEVDNLNEMVAKLREKGTRVKLEPFGTDVCHMAILLDPEGNAFTLHQKNPGRE